MGQGAYSVPGGFQSWRVTNPDQSEYIRQRLFDSQIYPAAGTQQLQFFTNPPGQGVTSALGGVVGQPKSEWDTNIPTSNQLPSGIEYLIESFEVLFEPGISSVANTYTPAAIGVLNTVANNALLQPSNDVNTFYQSGRLQFKVLAKTYLDEQPLMSFPPKAQLDMSGAVATTNVAATPTLQLTKAMGRPYYLDPPIALQSAVNFTVSLLWPAAVPTPSTFNGKVTVYLDGVMKRASQ